MLLTCTDVPYDMVGVRSRVLYLFFVGDHFISTKKARTSVQEEHANPGPIVSIPSLRGYRIRTFIDFNFGDFRI